MSDRTTDPSNEVGLNQGSRQDDGVGSNPDLRAQDRLDLLASKQLVERLEAVALGEKLKPLELRQLATDAALALSAQSSFETACRRCDAADKLLHESVSPILNHHDDLGDLAERIVAHLNAGLSVKANECQHENEWDDRRQLYHCKKCGVFTRGLEPGDPGWPSLKTAASPGAPAGCGYPDCGCADITQCAKTNAPTMAMLPNDHHPGPGCSCRECVSRYPVPRNDHPFKEGQFDEGQPDDPCWICGAFRKDHK